MVVGSVSPGNFDIFTVAFDGTGYQTIANGDDLGISFANPVAIGGRIIGAASKGVFSMNPDGSDFRIVKGDIESPITTPLTVNGDRIYGITTDIRRTPIGGGIIYSIPTDAVAVPEPRSIFVWPGLILIATLGRYRKVVAA